MSSGYSRLRPEAMSAGEVARFTQLALYAWRGIPMRQWTWTTTIALFLALAYLVGILPPLLSVVPNLKGPTRPPWDIAQLTGAVLTFFAAAYCFLLAVTIAEAPVWPRLPPTPQYVRAGLSACAAAILIEAALYALVPSMAPPRTGVPSLQHLLSTAVWSAANFGLTGGLALTVYVRLRSARLAREAFNATELERVGASREVLASQLAAMQARIEPSFLLGTLAQVEALYDRDPHAGSRMLDSLIAYLRAALPLLRGQRSTLRLEAHLVETYLDVVQIRMGSRLRFQVDVRPELDNCDFPPMVLLPLIDNALRLGLEPLPHGGTIAVTADANGDRVRVRISDDGLPRSSGSTDSLAIITLRERLEGLYGTSALLEVKAKEPLGTIVSIEVPLEPDCHHC